MNMGATSHLITPVRVISARSGDSEKFQGLIKRSALRVVGAALLFLFIYDLSFIAAPSLTTGRSVAALLTLVAFPRVAKALHSFGRAHLTELIILGMITVYSGAQYYFGGGLDNTQFSRLLHFWMFSILGSVLFAGWFQGDLHRFLSAFALAVAAQGLMIWYSYLSAEYRSWLSELLVQGGHIALDAGERAPGFSNSSGANLSLIQALGVFAALYAFRLSGSVVVRTFHVAEVIVSLTSTLLTGRTGLLMSIGFVLVFVATRRSPHKMFILAACAGVGILMLFYAEDLIDYLAEFNPQAQYTREWATEFFSKGKDAESLRGLAAQYIPPLTMETIIGTGLVSLDGLNVSGNDGGYIQTYYALGLIVALVFYITLVVLLVKLLHGCMDRVSLGILIGLMFLVELKEPFVFKYVFPFLVFSFAHMSRVKNGPAKNPRAQVARHLPNFSV